MHKLLQIALACTIIVTAASAAPLAPAKPSYLFSPPSGIIAITNVVNVYTNVAVKTPTLEFQNVTIYGGTNALAGSTCVSWFPATDTQAVGYKLYYGTVASSTTNTVTTASNVVTVLLYGVLQTNTTYWFYATALGSDGSESVPSNSILVAR